MRMVDRRGLQHWAEDHGLVWSAEYRRCPVGERPVRFAWPWPRPQGWSRAWYLADFIHAALSASLIDQPGGWYLWPNDGWWHEGGKEPYYRVRNAILGGLGIPMGFEGAADFAREEIDALAAAVFARCFMMDDCQGTVTDHVYVFPHHARLSLYFVDEELTWVEAGERGSLDLFNQKLVESGWGWLRDESQNDLVYPGALEEEN